MTPQNDGLPTLPANWVWSTVGALYDIVGGGTPSTAINEYWTGDIPWITSANIHGPKDIRPRKTITERAIKNSTTNLVPAGSLIVVTRVGLGKVAIAKESLCFSQDSQALVGFGDFLVSNFALYYLSMAVQAFKYQSRGTTISGVTKKQLAELSFPIAPFSEQQRIVQKIEELLTQLEAGIDELSRAQEQLKRYRQAVLKAAVTGELTKEWRETHKDELEPASESVARILKERRLVWEASQLEKMKAASRMPRNDKWRERYEPPFEPQIDNLPLLPDAWTWITVDQCTALGSTSLTDGPFGSNLMTKHYTEAGPRVIRLQNIGDGVFVDERAFISQEHFNSLKKHQILGGDLAIASLGEVSPRACLIPEEIGYAIVKADCIRFRPHPELAKAKYLNCALNAEQTRNRTMDAIHGVGRPRLGLSGIKRISLPLPPLREQQEIVAQVERCLSIAEAIEKTLDQSLVEAERLRQGILKQAFEGKLVPQDTNDEPAELLLERIKTKSAKREAEKQTTKSKPFPKKRTKRSERPAA